MSSQLPDIPKSASDVEVLTKLAVDRYDFESVRGEIADIIDIPSAIGRVGAWTAGLPIVVAVLSWLLFSSRMGGGALFLFILVLLLLAAVAGLFIGVAMVTRRRVDKTSAAANHIVEITGMVHADYAMVREGAARVSMRSVGMLAAREIVLPSLFGVAGRAAILGGPLGWLMRPLLGVVESKVTKALGELPGAPKALPAIQDTAIQDAAIQDAAIQDAAIQDTVREGRTAEQGPIVADEIIDPANVSAAYADIQDRFEKIVGRVGAVAVASSTAIALAAAIPVIVVGLLGWLLT